MPIGDSMALLPPPPLLGGGFDNPYAGRQAYMAMQESRRVESDLLALINTFQISTITDAVSGRKYEVLARPVGGGVPACSLALYRYDDGIAMSNGSVHARTPRIGGVSISNDPPPKHPGGSEKNFYLQIMIAVIDKVTTVKDEVDLLEGAMPASNVQPVFDAVTGNTTADGLFYWPAGSTDAAGVPSGGLCGNYNVDWCQANGMFSLIPG